MRLAISIQLAALAAAGLVAAGCGGSPPVAAPEVSSMEAAAPILAAPRTIDIPITARPLAAADAIELAIVADDSIAVHFTQPNDAATAPRIRDLSATPDATSSGIIREPGAVPPEVKEPVQKVAQAAPRRNSYVPISMPQFAPPAAAAESPQLAARPTFDLPASPTPQPGSYVAATHVSSHRPAAAMPLPREVPAPARQHTASAPQAFAPANTQALAVATGQASEISDRALVMTQRGLHYSARAEFIKSLQLVAQALDAQQGSGAHAAALVAGLTALEEAGDFVPSQSSSGALPSVAEIASSHRTAILRNTPAVATSHQAAQQQYFDFAQAQLATATGGLPVASRTLYFLGRLHTGLAANDGGSQWSHVPRAIAFHQAALAADGANYLAANELGVLLARTGQLPAARQALLNSISLRPHAEGWHNLAVVHRRLGEADLARRAEHERDLVAGQTSGSSNAKHADAVRWVDAPTLAASRAGDIPWRENARPELAALPAGQRR